jgi:hypothetical protein
LRTWLAALGLLLALTAGASEHDVFDRPVEPRLAGRPRLVLYANRHTRMDVRVQAAEMAHRLHRLAYVTVVRVDLRGIPGLFESFAYGNMRDAYAETTRTSRERRAAEGLPIPSDLDDRLIFVPESHGQRHQQMGLARGFEEALAVVEDAQGRELARGVFPQEIGRIEAALRRLEPAP